MDDKKSELSDYTLEQVVGGLEVMPVGRRQITTCDDFVCCWCGCRKASPTAANHLCEAQSGMGRTPSERLEAYFDNTCEWCEHSFTCPKAYTWVGLGSPTPPAQ